LEQLAEQHHPKNEPVTGRYCPVSEQVEEHYRPIIEPVAEQYRSISEQSAEHYRPNSGLTLGSNINNTKQENNIKQNGWQAVVNFFIEKSFNAEEGKKFYEHYQSRNWQTSDGNEIRDWRALALHWMERTLQFSKENSQNVKQVSQIKDNLRTTKNKNYGQPL
jgi:hypothetical protein